MNSVLTMTGMRFLGTAFWNLLQGLASIGGRPISQPLGTDHLESGRMYKASHDEAMAYGLDLQAHGSAKMLPILNLQRP
jgi:hypothetical protein